MNYWMDLSIQFANQRNYLDELYKVYPIIPEGMRNIDIDKWKKIEMAFNQKNKIELIKLLLSLDLFPIKYKDYKIMSALVLREFLYSI